MTLWKLTTAAVLSLGLMACEDTANTSLKAAPGQSVDEVARSLTQTRAIAAFLGTACRSEGIALREPSIPRALTQDIKNLKAQGYSEPALKAAFRRAGRDKSLTASAIRYLESRGARKGDRASVCAVGKREIADKTAIGRLLKKS